MFGLKLLPPVVRTALAMFLVGGLVGYAGTGFTTTLVADSGILGGGGESSDAHKYVMALLQRESESLAQLQTRARCRVARAPAAERVTAVDEREAAQRTYLGGSSSGRISVHLCRVAEATGGQYQFFPLALTVVGGKWCALSSAPAFGTQPMNSARAALILATFLTGLVTGVVVYAVTDRGTDANPYTSLPKAAEPAVTADVARAIQSDDARVLANLLDMEVLQQLQTAIEPLADIRSMKFVGAVEKSGRVLAAYVAGGKTSDGTDVLVGFVLNVTGDQIVGVN